MIIDIHGHISPPEMLKKYPMPPSLGDIEGMLEQRRRAGISLTFVGSPVGAGAMMRVPGVDNYAQTVDQLRAFHAWLSRTAHDSEGQLKAYVYTNPFGGDELLASALETLEDDAFVGLIVNTSVNGRFIGADEADGFFAMAEQADVPVLLHPPAAPAGSEQVQDLRLVEQVARFCDVTMAVASILLGGWLDRYPGLQLIAATAGGASCLLPEKLDLAHQPRHWGPPASNDPGRAEATGPATTPPSEQLRRINVDTTSPNPFVNGANVDVFGTSQMLFGTDSPPLSRPLGDAVAAIEALPIPLTDRQNILAGNAQRVFKLGTVDPDADTS